MLKEDCLIYLYQYVNSSQCIYFKKWLFNCGTHYFLLKKSICSTNIYWNVPGALLRICEHRREDRIQHWEVEFPTFVIRSAVQGLTYEAFPEFRGRRVAQPSEGCWGQVSQKRVPLGWNQSEEGNLVRGNMNKGTEARQGLTGEDKWQVIWFSCSLGVCGRGWGESERWG